MTEIAEKPETEAELQTILNKFAVAIKQVAVEHGHKEVVPDRQPCGIVLFMFYDKSEPNKLAGHTTISLGDIDVKLLLKFLVESFPELLHTQPDSNQYIR